MSRWLICGLLVVLLTGCDSTAPEPATSESVNTVGDLRTKLSRLKYQRDRLQLAQTRLETERTTIRDRLKAAGVTSVSNLPEKPEWKIHARELRDVLSRMEKIESDLGRYDTAILQLESLLRRHERDQRTATAKLTEEERNNLSTILHEVEAELSSPTEPSAVEELELQELLRNELSH